MRVGARERELEAWVRTSVACDARSQPLRFVMFLRFDAIARMNANAWDACVKLDVCPLEFLSSRCSGISLLQ